MNYWRFVASEGRVKTAAYVFAERYELFRTYRSNTKSTTHFPKVGNVCGRRFRGLFTFINCILNNDDKERKVLNAYRAKMSDGE